LVDMNSKTADPICSNDVFESRQDVAMRIGCHPKTVQRAEQRGELAPVKFNTRLVRYRRSDVDAWIAKACVATANNTLCASRSLSKTGGFKA